MERLGLLFAGLAVLALTAGPVLAAPGKVADPAWMQVVP